MPDGQGFVEWFSDGGVTFAKADSAVTTFTMPDNPVRVVVTYRESFVTLGDVNNDGEVDIADAVCIVNHIIGKPNAVYIEEAADTNGDNDIDIADAVCIVNYVIGRIAALPPPAEDTGSQSAPRPEPQ